MTARLTVPAQPASSLRPTSVEPVKLIARTVSLATMVSTIAGRHVPRQAQSGDCLALVAVPAD